MTGEPGRPEKQQEITGESPAHVEKRTVADAEAALRQFEQEQLRQQRSHADAVLQEPIGLAPETAVEARVRQKWFRLRHPISLPMSMSLALVSVALVFGLWWFVTWGAESEDRIVNAFLLPSPAETFGEFKYLWGDREETSLPRNIWVTIRRVALGFSLAAIVGVPLGILAGCFAPLRALLAPLVIFGRNIPLAALIPLTYLAFGIEESQKVLFIFIACVAFVIADATNAITDVSQKYIDTAYTLGANRWQTIIKVLTPLAMPSIFNSLRLLFGLAFGYIMLAELVKSGDEAGGLGNLISVFQRRGVLEPIYLIILLIPIIALVIDRCLYWCQRQLFPYRYGSVGALNGAVKMAANFWDDLKTSLFKPVPPFDQLVKGKTKPLDNEQSEAQLP